MRQEVASRGTRVMCTSVREWWRCWPPRRSRCAVDAESPWAPASRRRTDELGRACALQRGERTTQNQEGSWTSTRESLLPFVEELPAPGSPTGAERDVRAWPRLCASDGRAYNAKPGRILDLY